MGQFTFIFSIFFTTVLISQIDGSEEDQVTSELLKIALKPPGATFIRWGRSVCPDSADLMYTGVIAGSKEEGFDSATGSEEKFAGGGSNYLCLPTTPQFEGSAPGQQDSRARIYAAEYRSGENGALNKISENDGPCVLCESKGGRMQFLMMPATTQCPSGWTKEYGGYLAAAKWNHPRTEHVCLDQHPEILSGGQSDNPQTTSSLFQVEVGSASGLPSAYETGRDLNCAICTR